MSNTAPSGWFLYGGADVSEAVDAASHYYLACYARPSDGKAYAFHIFRDGVDLPLNPRPTGRGQIQPMFTPTGITYTYIGWTGALCVRGDVPGFVPFQGGGGGSGAITIPKDSPIWSVYTGEYTSDAELQSAPGLFVRFNKLKDGLLDLVARLLAAGVIVRGK